MDQHQLREALVTPNAELEYLLNDQWVPAAIANSTTSHFIPSGTHSQNITIQLLSYPHDHSGVIHATADDIENRLRIKAS